MMNHFITFEGTEGAGKSSIINAVKEFFVRKGYEVIVTREPGGTTISEQIRNIILDVKHTEMDAKTEALLYAASRRQHVQELILPALKEGKIVLCDRYVDSSLVYQGLARGIGINEVLELNQFAMEGLLPKYTLFIDVKPEVGLKRIADNKRDLDRLDLEKIDFHNLVYSGYEYLMETYPNRYIRIDGEQPKELVIQEVLSKLNVLY